MQKQNLKIQEPRERTMQVALLPSHAEIEHNDAATTVRVASTNALSTMSDLSNVLDSRGMSTMSDLSNGIDGRRELR
jgi:hypothetical protein